MNVAFHPQVIDFLEQLTFELIHSYFKDVQHMKKAVGYVDPSACGLVLIREIRLNS